MGMFDSFFGKYRCEECGSSISFEEQTKAYECVLRDFYLGDYVEGENKNYYYRFENTCPKCKHENKLAIAIRNGQYVDVISADEADATPITAFSNIAYGLERKRMYDENCKAMLGEEMYARKVSFIGKKVGDEIQALGEKWIIDKIYVIQHRRTDKAGELFHSMDEFRGGSYLINVHNDKCNRVILIGYSRFCHCYNITVYRGTDTGERELSDREYYQIFGSEILIEKDIITDEITYGDKPEIAFEEGSMVWMETEYFGELPCVVEHITEVNLGYNYDVSFCGYTARNVPHSLLRERKS